MVIEIQKGCHTKDRIPLFDQLKIFTKVCTLDIVFHC